MAQDARVHICKNLLIAKGRQLNLVARRFEVADNAYFTETSEAMTYAAMLRLLLKRLAKALAGTG